MKTFEDDLDAWKNVILEDIWVFNKLVVARKLGHLCGPVGEPVPMTGFYIIRPVINILGMGRGAEKVYVQRGDDLSDRYDPSYFWCEVFEGRHLSTDFREGHQALCVEGFREEDAPFYKWKCWRKVHNIYRELPDICRGLEKRYKWINIEEIDGKIIEIHLRRNPDFMDASISEIIPIWTKDHPNPRGSDWKFVSSPDYERIGFYVR